MNSNILVGSASWTDPTLLACGRFYPPEARTPEARLRYYATQFPLVEVDSSYYGIPTQQNAQLWAQRTPADFVFNVKAFRLFTGHSAPPKVLHRDIRQALAAGDTRSVSMRQLPAEIQDELWRRFLIALEPLRAAGKLGVVHFQFSPGILRNRDGMAWAEHCVQKMQGHLLSFEFRNRTWFDAGHAEDTLAFQRQLGVVHTVVDSPQGFSNCVPCIWEATHPRVALVRLHGRNKETWNITRGTASSSRFSYWYSPDELAAMVPEVEHLASVAQSVHVVFNTNDQDQGQINARLMRQLLSSVKRR